VARALLILCALVFLAGCGSSGNSSGGQAAGGGKPSSGIVAEVSHADLEDEGPKGVTSTIDVKVGGKPGQKLTLEWGLVDAHLGTESQEERVVKRYVTTAKTVSDEQSITVPRKQITSALLVHWVLYGPDGSYLDSADTDEFGPGSDN
jgi:hypothetical protein